jgi:hypothetical protein
LVVSIQNSPFSLFSSGILYPGSGPHTENDFGKVHIYENHEFLIFELHGQQLTMMRNLKLAVC